MKKYLITPIIVIVFYFFVLIPSLEHAARQYFAHAQECILKGQVSECEGVWDDRGHLAIPWWVSFYDHITYRPLVR